ncbi:hypothetical protein GGR53DRAFT_490516 [Hypoxylon sp. FL1150]|nr:hypothetical protein GGR53DRAFT_490516 [Hypoxylon sp. FL1150]
MMKAKLRIHEVHVSFFRRLSLFAFPIVWELINPVTVSISPFPFRISSMTASLAVDARIIMTVLDFRIVPPFGSALVAIPVLAGFVIVSNRFTGIVTFKLNSRVFVSLNFVLMMCTFLAGLV